MLILTCFIALLLPAQIRVDPAQVINHVSDDMYGSCIEDVNHEIYGGLYDQKIFGESFEEPAPIEGPAGWRALDGNWSSTNGAISCKAGNGPMLILSGQKFSNGTVEARVKTGSNQSGSAGLIVRAGNATPGIDIFDGYEIAYQAKSGTLQLSRHRHDYQPLAQVPAPIQAGETHLLRTVLEGSRIQVFLDAETTPRIDFTDRDRPILAGTVALRPWQADCTFSDIKIDGHRVSLQLNAGGLSGMWDPIGHPILSLDRHAYNGTQCQKIVNDHPDETVGIFNQGLNRWGIAVKAGQRITGRIALRGSLGSVTVALQSADGSHTYDEFNLKIPRTWKSQPVYLNSRVDDPHARFAILLRRPGTVFVDQVVLLDANRFHALPVRDDIAKKMVGERLTFLRYGGSMTNSPGYRWKKMIGNSDLRPPYRGTWYPYSTNGFGIFDFLNFCEKANFRTAFAINIEETPQDAADLADYLTAPVNTHWGALRAADGHPNPYSPEYIEIGNEEGIGSSPHPQLIHYAERFHLLEKAIHGRNLNLKLVCAAWWTPGSPDMEPVFRAIDGKAAAWDIHIGADDLNSGEAVDKLMTDIESDFKRWNSKTNLKTVVFEENGGLHNVQRALGHALVLNATRRHGDFVLADCPANCLQPLGQNDNGWDQGQIFFTPDRVWGMPPYSAQQLLSLDRQPLRVFSSSEASLDVTAIRSRDGKSVVLTVVNSSDGPADTKVALANFRIDSAQSKFLTGKLDDTEPTLFFRKFPRPERGQLNMTFPAHSVTSLQIFGSLLNGDAR